MDDQSIAATSVRFADGLVDVHVERLATEVGAVCLFGIGMPALQVLAEEVVATLREE